ncbi:FAD-dependent oxidoreductase, partial [Herbaspirillum sp. B65]|uniref:FAD-dependent oxidoreductase n=1 Tax=Herbaspirillum sp. B65 TaxID=137708 RepID=UPI0005C8F868
MSTDTNGKAVIVGAGHAAGVMAVNLREAGWQGSIVMVGEEAHLPYQRPPLSKAFLAGEVEIEQLYLKPVATYERAGVEFIGATRVESIDRAARRVHLADGRALAWDKLVLATGGRVRRLGGANAEAAARMPNFHYLRTIDD